MHIMPHTYSITLRVRVLAHAPQNCSTGAQQ
jgi:hypothetical protein